MDRSCRYTYTSQCTQNNFGFYLSTDTLRELHPAPGGTKHNTLKHGETKENTSSKKKKTIHKQVVPKLIRQKNRRTSKEPQKFISRRPTERVIIPAKLKYLLNFFNFSVKVLVRGKRIMDAFFSDSFTTFDILAEWKPTLRRLFPACRLSSPMSWTLHHTP